MCVLISVQVLRPKLGGDHKRSEYVQYVPVILADVPARTTFIDIYNHALNKPKYVLELNRPKSVLVRARTIEFYIC